MIIRKQTVGFKEASKDNGGWTGCPIVPSAAE